MQPSVPISIVVDRIEGDLVVVDYQGRQYDLPLIWFAPEPTEGSAWILDIRSDPAATEALTLRVRQTLKKLTAEPADDGGELEL